MAAENDVDAGDAAGELQIDVHAVVREQDDGVDLVLLPQAIDDLLQLAVADAEGPVRREALGMRDRHIRERLADDADAEAADFFDRRRLEHAAGCLVEGRLVVERGFLGQEHVLRQELALEALEIGAQPFLAIGEFPMAGRGLDAEEICGVHHVLAVHGIGETAALPEIAAVEQQRAARARFGAQAVDQRLQMREAAEPAVAVRGLREIEIGEGVRQPRFRRDAEMLEKGLADQMRRPAGHAADAEIDARLAEIHRRKLRMRVGHVQHARIAELADVVEIVGFGGAGEARNDAGKRRRREQLQHVAATHRISLLNSAPAQRMTASASSSFRSLACCDRGLGQGLGLVGVLDGVVELAGVGRLLGRLELLGRRRPLRS